MVLGDNTPAKGMAPGVAGFVQDLHRAGVRWEVQETPTNWLATEKVKPALVAVAAAPEQPVEKPVERVEKPTVKVEKAAVPGVVEAPKEVAVWTAGEAGGVVLMVRGNSEPVGADLELLRVMLAAVGLQDEKLGWVGLTLDEDMFVKGMEAKVGLAVAKMEPHHVLVLGSAVLGSWLGKNRGVEGWVNGSVVLEGLPEGARVGVTYAPGMLRQKPLFKRLAWKHLVQWVA